MNTTRQYFLLTVLLLLLSACGDSSEYRMQAREYLMMQGVSEEVIERLMMQAELGAGDTEFLSEYENGSVLHLVAANPGTPLHVLEELAEHDDIQVRLGVAENPNTPPGLLQELRTTGRYTAVNAALARNPNLPPELLQEMFLQHEAPLSSLARNPHTPPDVLRAIARGGEDLDRVWLAGNPSLPEDVVQQLEQDPSRVVRARLQNRHLQDTDAALAAH